MVSQEGERGRMSKKYGHCPVPNCERRLIPGRSPHGLCPKHEEDLDFLLFILPKIKAEPLSSKSGIILPGSPEFKVTKTSKGGLNID